MAQGDEQALDRYADVPGALRGRRRLQLARAGALDVVHGLGFVDDDLDRPLATFSGGAADARARWRARWPPSPTCCCSTSRPTTSTSSRWSGWRRRCSASTRRSSSSPTTAGSWRRSAPRVLELEAGRSRFFKGTWHAWRKEQAAREMALGKAIDKQQAEIARMERFVERFRCKAIEGAPGAVAPQEARQDRAHRARPARRARARVPVQEARALGPRDLRARGRARRGRRRDPPRAAAGTTPSCGSSAASTCRSSGPNGTGKTTLIEALAGERPLDGGQAAHRATTSRSATSASTARSSRRRRRPHRRSRRRSSARA